MKQEIFIIDAETKTHIRKKYEIEAENEESAKVKFLHKICSNEKNCKFNKIVTKSNQCHGIKRKSKGYFREN